MMNDVSVAKFVTNATRQDVNKQDDRVAKQLIDGYAKCEESKANRCLNLSEFLDFYYDACKDPTRVGVVYENLINHNVRTDLKKLSEVDDDSWINQEDMPRFSISANQSQFNTLFSLLDRNDSYSKEVWDLVRMLNTNRQTFTQILTLSKDGANGVNWAKVFEDESLYKQIYKQEIIMAVMERDEEGMTDRVIVTDQQDEVLTDKKDAVEKEKSQEELEKEEELRKLKTNWAKLFLNEGGIQYSLDQMLKVQLQSGESYSFSQLKNIAFFSTLAKVFLTVTLSAANKSVSEGI